MMTRQQYLWLFIWIFIFFLLFCIWNKLQHYTPKILDNTPTKQIQSKPLKEIHFKVIKREDAVTLSGIVASEDDKNRLVDAYGKAFNTVAADTLIVDKNVKENALLDFFTNFADNFSNFDSGYLAYANGTIEVDGIAQDNIVDQTLNEQLKTLTNVKVDNKLIINTKVKQEDDITDENITKKISRKTAEDVQKALDTLLKNRRVQFLYARDVLTSGSKLLVDKISRLLKENDAIKVEISGYTDSDGTKKNNLRLSQRRAENIKKYLVKQGIEKRRLKAIGYGESRPLVINNSLKNKEINRRVEFKVIGE